MCSSRSCSGPTSSTPCCSSGTSPGPRSRRPAFESSHVTSATDQADANPGGYESPDADAIIAAARGSTDQAQRAHLYGQLADLLARDVPACARFGNDTGWSALSSRVAGAAGPIDPSAPRYLVEPAIVGACGGFEGDFPGSLTPFRDRNYNAGPFGHPVGSVRPRMRVRVWRGGDVCDRMHVAIRPRKRRAEEVHTSPMRSTDSPRPRLVGLDAVGSSGLHE